MAMRWGCGGRFRCASVCYCSRIYSARDSLSLPHHLQEEGGRGEVSCSAYQLIFDKIVLLLLCLYYSDRIDMTCVDIKKKKKKTERRKEGRRERVDSHAPLIQATGRERRRRRRGRTRTRILILFRPSAM